MHGTFAGLLAEVEGVARAAGVFASVEVVGEALVCRADGSAEDAFYRVELEGGAVWVSLVMKDRWLSESIESDLMHTGDSIEELLEEELAELGHEGEAPGVEHFRSEDKLFTFRSRAPEATPEVTGRLLMAYERCFRQLGDMDEGDQG